MSLKTLLLVVPVVSLAALTGCKASCTGLCDDAKDQDCATTDTISVNGIDEPKSNFDHAGCYAACQREDDMESDDVTDCADDFDKLLSCMSDQSDICKVFEYDDYDTYDDGYYKFKKCSSEQHEYAQCYVDYCKDHEKRDYCN